MLDYISQKAKLSLAWLIPSFVIIAIGNFLFDNAEIFGTVGIILSCTFMLTASIIALMLQFDLAAVKRLLGKMKPNSWKFILLGVGLCILCSAIPNLIAMTFGMSTVTNSSMTGMGTNETWQEILVLISFIPTLIGEELFVAAMAFPIFYLLAQKLPQKNAWIFAAILSAIIFGLFHMPVYDNNLYYCLITIPLTRLPVTWLWTKTDSLWGGIICHIIYDFIIFIPAMFL